MKKRITLFAGVSVGALAILAALIYLFTRPTDLKTKSEILQSVALSVAVVIGGLWATYRFFIQRLYETALEIDLSMMCSPYVGSKFLVFVDTVLTNRGQTRISARPRKYLNSKPLPSYMDAKEQLHYSLGLQIKRIEEDIHGNTALDWFESKHLDEVQGIPNEINLLNEYDYSTNGAVDLWIEPNETYHCAIPLILPKGHYVAKVAFIGNRGGFEFWSRIFHLHVAEPSSTVSNTQAVS